MASLGHQRGARHAGVARPCADAAAGVSYGSTSQAEAQSEVEVLRAELAKSQRREEETATLAEKWQTYAEGLEKGRKDNLQTNDEMSETVKLPGNVREPRDETIIMPQTTRSVTYRMPERCAETQRPMPFFIDDLATADPVTLGKRVAAWYRCGVHHPELAAESMKEVVRWAKAASERARELRSGPTTGPVAVDPTEHDRLFIRLQLAASAVFIFADRELSKNGETIDEHGSDWLDLALSCNAYLLCAQDSVWDRATHPRLQHEWRGHFFSSSKYGRELGLRRCTEFAVLLLLQLPLLPIVALLPPLGHWLRRRSEITKDSSYLLHLPMIKFWLASVADVGLALTLTVVRASTLREAPVAWLLLVWVVSALVSEANQFWSGGSTLARRAAEWWRDHFNRYDLLGLVLSFVLLFPLATNSIDGISGDEAWWEWWGPVRAFAVFFLWLRTLRVLLVWTTLGKYAIMVNEMLYGDVLYFVILLAFPLVGIGAAWTVLLESSSQLGDYTVNTWVDRSPVRLIEAAGCADELWGTDLPSTLVLLLEGALTGSDFFHCARSSTDAPVAAWLLSLTFCVLTVVLLLNMLIAMMSKTFDRISDSSTIISRILFSKRVFSSAKELPAPPPLYALSLPYNLLRFGWVLIYGCCQGETSKAGPSEHGDLPRVFELTEHTKNLAMAITDYIVINEPGAAQRANSSIQRRMQEGFRDLDRKIGGLHGEIRSEISRMAWEIQQGRGGADPSSQVAAAIRDLLSRMEVQEAQQKGARDGATELLRTMVADMRQNHGVTTEKLDQLLALAQAPMPLQLPALPRELPFPSRPSPPRSRPRVDAPSLETPWLDLRKPHYTMLGGTAVGSPPKKLSGLSA